MRCTVPCKLAERDEVAGFDRLLEREDDAADEVVGDALQAEADADAEHAGEDRQRAQVEPGHLQDDDEADEDEAVPHQRRHRLQRAVLAPVARMRRMLTSRVTG